MKIIKIEELKKRFKRIKTLKNELRN